VGVTVRSDRSVIAVTGPINDRVTMTPVVSDGMRAIGAFLIFGLSALGVALDAAATPAADSQVGAVLARDYTGAKGTRTSGEERQLFFDLPVFSAERVDTGVEASTALNLLDNTHLQVGPNSSVVLDRFVYDPERHTGEAAISFTRGLFRFVTGEMKNKDGFDLRTPSATLAIRGTKFIVFVAADGRSDISVIEGEVLVRSCDGVVHLVGPNESVSVAGDCTESHKSFGRTAPRHPSVDQDYTRFSDNSGVGGRDGTGTSGGGKRAP
jgi:hypothetical protein